MYMYILGIETSCDETAASIIKFNQKTEKIQVLSNIVSSQIEIHKKYGGVVPEVAAREHVLNILPVINEALTKAQITPQKLKVIGVTKGPGLITSLITGVETVRALAYAWNKPIIEVNHINGHIYANFINPISPEQVKNRIKSIRLSEISLVDRPANPEAVFAMVKMDKSGKIVDIQSPMQMQDGTGTAVGVNTTDSEMKDDHPPVTVDSDCLTDAQIVLHLAADIRNLINVFEYNGKPTAQLERALTTLKALASKILTDEEKKKFETVLYAISPEEIEKNKLPYKDRKTMPKGEFAYVDSKGEKHLPIHDGAHAKNAMARWNQTQFESPEKKAAAARKILAAARRFGVEIDPSSGIAQAAKKAEDVDITKYVNVNWTPGYFEQMKKIMG